MEARLLLHAYGPTPDSPPGVSQRLYASPELPDEVIESLETHLHYGSPENPDLSPPVAWSVVPVGGDAVALTRSWRAPSVEGAPCALQARSVVIPSSLDPTGSGEVAAFARNRELFPDIGEPSSVPPALDLAVPPAAGRSELVFAALLRAIRGDRAALTGLIAAAADVADGTGPLRAIVFALAAPAFRDEHGIFETLVGLCAAVPRAQRGRLGLCSYQDSPAPRLLALLAIPSDHRCIDRLGRSSGYVVHPGATPANHLLQTRSLEYARIATELLMAGRFEEVQALSATFELRGSTAVGEARPDLEQHADLLRLAQSPDVSAVLEWIDAHELPESGEKRGLLYDVIARALGRAGREERHGAGVRILRTLGVRWAALESGEELSDALRGPLVAFVRSWHQLEGWAPVAAVFGRLAGGGGWLRELMSAAVAEAVAETVDVVAPPDEAVVAVLEAQYDALERAVPPNRYLRWRVHRLGDDDGRVRAYVLRLLALPRGMDELLALLSGFESPRHEVFGRLLETALSPLAKEMPTLARNLVGELVAHFGPDGDGLALLRRAVHVLLAAEADELVVGLVATHVLQQEGLAPAARRRQRELIRLAARFVRPALWEEETQRALGGWHAESSPAENDEESARRRRAMRVLLANLRVLWCEALDRDGGPSTRRVARIFDAIHAAVPALAEDPAPHAALARAGGARAGAALAIDDTLLLAERGTEEEVRRFLVGVFCALDRLFPEEPWSWQRALVSAALAEARPAEDQATALWWLWSAAGSADWTELARHAAHTIVLGSLLTTLDEGRFERLCRVLPSETGLSRERLVLAAVEGSLYTWTRRPEGTVNPGLFRHFSPQADALSAAAYRKAVERYGETCLLRPGGTAEDLRTVLDRVYVPRHWEVLAAVMKSLASRNPRLRAQLTSLRRTTLGRRLPPQLLGAFDQPFGDG